jgi:hypothetical protein
MVFTEATVARTIAWGQVPPDSTVVVEKDEHGWLDRFTFPYPCSRASVDKRKGLINNRTNRAASEYPGIEFNKILQRIQLQREEMNSGQELTTTTRDPSKTWGVYNLKTGGVTFTETEDHAMKTATEFLQKDLTVKYLILKPHQVVGVPIHVSVEQVEPFVEAAAPTGSSAAEAA